MAEAIEWAASPRATALVDDGCDVVACATNLDRARLASAAPGVVAGSQDDHAAQVRRADRVVAFT